MFDALKGIACFVTVAVSFVYGTRTAWICGKQCGFKEKPKDRKEYLLDCLPTASLLYFFGFAIIFSLALDGFLTVGIFSLTSAIVLAHVVVSMAMPELKRESRQR